ncbi:MAG: SixA phosphatase family protein [Alphaproteobacteria bacterium]
MKRLFLMRHAKSSWDDLAFSDFDRPLAERGREACLRLARYLRGTELPIDLVLCSGAARARETWERIAGALAQRVPVEYEDALYMAGPGSLLARLRGLDPALNTVLLVAHNPDVEILAQQLCRRGGGEPLARLEVKYPTGGLAEIALDCADWAEVKEACGTLKHFTVPRELP